MSSASDTRLLDNVDGLRHELGISAPRLAHMLGVSRSTMWRALTNHPKGNQALLVHALDVLVEAKLSKSA